jgi:hypothetical protein
MKLKLVFLYIFRVRVKIVIYYGSKPVVYPTGGGGEVSYCRSASFLKTKFRNHRFCKHHGIKGLGNLPFSQNQLFTEVL